MSRELEDARAAIRHLVGELVAATDTSNMALRHYEEKRRKLDEARTERDVAIDQRCSAMDALADARTVAREQIKLRKIAENLRDQQRDEARRDRDDAAAANTQTREQAFQLIRQRDEARALLMEMQQHASDAFRQRDEAREEIERVHTLLIQALNARRR